MTKIAAFWTRAMRRNPASPLLPERAARRKATLRRAALLTTERQVFPNRRKVKRQRKLCVPATAMMDSGVMVRKSVFPESA